MTVYNEYQAKLKECDLTEEFSCLNGLQDTAWMINKPVLEVIRKVWDSGEGWGSLPNKVDIALEEYPFSVDPNDLTEEQKINYTAWCRRRSETYQHNAQSMSKRVQVERTIQMAEDHAQYEEFYFIWQSDFRGRKYPLSAFMTPQSADWGKALLTFAEGVAITTREEAKWLCIHGANTFGADKISLEDRVIWAFDHAEEAVRVAQDPLNNRWWTEFDKPYQGLAWCFEFAGFIERGYGFVSHLPCAADGTANGLQHLSAMLRDEKGGKAVNLIPSDKPSDIYADVAEEAKAAILVEAEAGDEMAALWLQFGIDRSITKRPVMIVPYSGTQHACRAYIEESIKEKIAKGAVNVFGDQIFQASMYLAKYVWAAISGVIVSAKEAMAFIKNVSVAYSKAKMNMEWITPTGFLVVQKYTDQSEHMIKTTINGNVIKLKCVKELPDTVDSKRTKLGSSPNFIHSLDASAMTKTVNACVKLGISSFAMIHDSFGTHSAKMPELSDTLREQFIEMYIEHDVLADLRDHARVVLGEDAELPELPAKGTLNVVEVFNSDYFFS